MTCNAKHWLRSKLVPNRRFAVVKIVSLMRSRSLLRGVAGSLVVLLVVVGVGSSSASSKQPVVKRKRVPKVAARPPVTKVVSSLPVVKDPLGRDYCGDAKVVLRVPVTTIPCQTPLPDEQLATKEALLAAYENYWVSRVVAGREPRLGRSQYQKVSIAEAYNDDVATDVYRLDNFTYWFGVRSDIQLANTRIRSLNRLSAVIVDCVLIGGVVRSHKTGGIVPGSEGIDRKEFEFLMANISGIWLVTRIRLSDDGSIDGQSKCNGTDS
jgi:hypothetical protein